MSGKSQYVYIGRHHEFHGVMLPSGWYMTERSEQNRYKTPYKYMFRNRQFEGIRYPACVYMADDGWFWVKFETLFEEKLGPFAELEAALACASMERGRDAVQGMPEDTYGNGAY